LSILEKYCLLGNHIIRQKLGILFEGNVVFNFRAEEYIEQATNNKKSMLSARSIIVVPEGRGNIFL
jgi:hypothetical protein